MRPPREVVRRAGRCAAEVPRWTITSTAGNQIVGSTGLTKTNAGTLTLVGPNLYTGQTSVGGGVLGFV